MVEKWGRTLRRRVVSSFASTVRAPHLVGAAIEIRLGLDLAERLPYAAATAAVGLRRCGQPLGTQSSERSATRLLLRVAASYTYNDDDSLKTTKLVGFHNPDGTTHDYVLEETRSEV